MKFFVKSLDEVEQQFRSLYTQVEGGFQLAIEGLPTQQPHGDDRARLAEFRSNNIRLQQEIDALKKQYEGFDPAKFKRANDALKKLQDAEERELIEAGRWDELVSRRTDAMRTAHGEEVKALKDARDKSTTEATALRERLNGLMIGDRMDAMMGELKIKPSHAAARGDITTRAQAIFTLAEDGKSLSPTVGGKTHYGKAGTPVTEKEWLQQLVQSAPHLFEPSKGGNAAGGGGVIRQGEIAADDDAAFLANVGDIATGKVSVQSTE